jgi:acyl-CoA thioesterase I
MRTNLAAALVTLAMIATASAGERLDIVAFGTSLTARRDWQEALGVRLSDCLGRTVAIQTVAQSGANSDWAVANLDPVVALQPAVVLVEFAINDASLLHGVSAGQSIANTSAIVARLRVSLPAVRIVLMTMNPATGIRALSRPFLGSFYEAYRTLAPQLGVELADLSPLWEAHGLTAEALPDGLHPTGTAARAVIVPALARLLGGPGCD